MKKSTFKLSEKWGTYNPTLLNRVVEFAFLYGDTSTAQYAYEMIVSHFPESELLAQSRIQFEMLTHNYRNALKSIELLEKKLNGTDDYLLTQKCAILYQAGEIDRALEICGQATLSDPKNSSSPQYLLLIYCNRGDWQNAIRQVDRFVREFKVPLEAFRKESACNEFLQSEEFKVYEKQFKK